MDFPKVTLTEVENSIAYERYLVEETVLTICILKCKNGFIVIGESACISPENFNAELGRKLARENAIDKLWAFLGFSLADKLST